MPGYIIHLTEAKRIFDRLKQQSEGDKRYSNEWLQEFSYGALLPDSAVRTGKTRSHFWNVEQSPCIVMTPRVDWFLNEYQVSVDTPLLLGYLAHLDLDLRFWKEYMRQAVQFQKKDGERAEDIREVASVLVRRTGKSLPLEAFFSPEYLYGDYGRLNKHLIKKYHLQIPEYNTRYQKMVKEVNNEDMEKILCDLNRYLEEEGKERTSLEILSEDSIESFIEETARKFVQKILLEKGCFNDVQQRAFDVFHTEASEENLWKLIVAFQGYTFRTATGLPFQYKVKIGKKGNLNKELVIDRRENSKTLSWSSIRLAFENASKIEEVVSRPKALGDIRGISYIYPMLWRFGVIKVPEKISEKMK